MVGSQHVTKPHSRPNRFKKPVRKAQKPVNSKLNIFAKRPSLGLRLPLKDAHFQGGSFALNLVANKAIVAAL